MKIRNYTVQIAGPRGPEELTGDVPANVEPSTAARNITADHARSQGHALARYQIADYWINYWYAEGSR